VTLFFIGDFIVYCLLVTLLLKTWTTNHRTKLASPRLTSLQH